MTDYRLSPPTTPGAGLRRLAACGLFLLVSGLSAPRATAQAPLDAREVLDQLRNVAVDPGQVYVLRDAQIVRDRVRFYFNRGFVGFLTRAGGEITGAVFSGDGEVLLIPPNPIEKRNLSEFTKSPILEERFSSVYLRFTDRTAQELLAVARRPDPEDPEQPTGFVERWNPLVRALAPTYSGRILVDLLGDRTFPYFLARIQGVNLPTLEVADDERVPEAISVGAVQRQGETFYADSWCSFPSRTSEARFPALLEGPALVQSYAIETRLLADKSLEGQAELVIESLSRSDRVLPFELSHWLKVSEVKDESGRTLTVLQYPSSEESQGSARKDDWIEVILPAAHPVGEKFRLVFHYKGSVITDVGNGVLYVGARGSWYPSRQLGRSAAYDLTFHYPQGLTLVATGNRVEEKTSEGWTESRWRSDGVFRVAGFNLGPYHSVSRQVRNVGVEVYATQEAEARLEERHAAVQGSEIVRTTPVGPEGQKFRLFPRLVAPLRPTAFLDSVAERAVRAVEYYNTLFGSFPYPRMAISQIPGDFGQGWPELVYLPTTSFLLTSERTEMGLGGKSHDLVNQSILAHEVAHQWWGNLVGWKTYHDQWLSEGLASYAAALYLGHEKDGERNFRDLLRMYKSDLLSKTKTGATVESGGPIWLGQRLSNSLNPGGYDAIIYNKACWVLHMLRGLLRDSASGSDERFFQMLRDFLAAHRGEEVSTEDFIHHAEKYMSPASDLDRDRRLDWFFNEWVYGTGVPTYQVATTTKRLAPGKYLVQGTIEQSGVSPDFQMLVPVVAVMGKERVTLGRVAVGETKAHFKFTTSARPSRVTVDEDNLLAVVQ